MNLIGARHDGVYGRAHTPHFSNYDYDNDNDAID